MTRTFSLLVGTLATCLLATGCTRDTQPTPAPAPSLDMSSASAPDASGEPAPLVEMGSTEMPSAADMSVDAPRDMSPDSTDDGARDLGQEDACALSGDGGVVIVASSGDDSAEGTREAPVATISEAISRAEPGDTILVGDGVYNELIVFDRSGEEGRPITLRNDCDSAPVIDASGLSSPDDGLPAGIKIVDQHHVTVSGFEIRGVRASRADDFPSGVWVRGAAHDITLEKLRVHDVRAWRDGDRAGAHGIAFYGTSPSPMHHVELRESEVFDLTLGWSEAVVFNGNVRDFVVTRNTVRDVDNIAFDFIGFEPDVCPDCSDDDGVDAEDLNRARAGLVSQNTAHDVSSQGNPAYGDDKSAGCFYVDGGADIILERNTARHCDIGLELASEAPGKSTRGVIVRNNVFYLNDVVGIATGGYSDGDGPGGGSATGCYVVNNTIYDSSRDGWANTGLLLQNRNVANTYANNIIVATPQSSAIADYGARNSDNVFANNIIFQGGLDGIIQEAGLQADPGLSDPEMLDFSLSPSSLARDAGLELDDAIVGELDYAGAARRRGAIDVGAHEFSAD